MRDFHSLKSLAVRPTWPSSSHRLVGKQFSQPAVRRGWDNPGTVAGDQGIAADRLRNTIRAYHATCDLVAAGRAIVGPLPSDNSLVEQARLAVVASLDACTEEGITDAELDAIVADEAERAGPQGAASSRGNVTASPPAREGSDRVAGRRGQ